MPMIRFILFAPLLAVAAYCQTYTVVTDHAVPAKMRDGVTLIADVYRPKADGKFPVLLQRTPYNRIGGARSAEQMSERGYVVIIQDTRGRFDSQGEFCPFRFESQDGYDSVEWAATARSLSE